MYIYIYIENSDDRDNIIQSQAPQKTCEIMCVCVCVCIEKLYDRDSIIQSQASQEIHEIVCVFVCVCVCVCVCIEQLYDRDSIIQSQASQKFMIPEATTRRGQPIRTLCFLKTNWGHIVKRQCPCIFPSALVYFLIIYTVTIYMYMYIYNNIIILLSLYVRSLYIYRTNKDLCNQRAAEFELILQATST